MAAIQELEIKIQKEAGKISRDIAGLLKTLVNNETGRQAEFADSPAHVSSLFQEHRLGENREMMIRLGLVERVDNPPLEGVGELYKLTQDARDFVKKAESEGFYNQ